MLKPGTRACVVYALGFSALTFLSFSLPVYFSEVVTVRIETNIPGQSGEVVAPGNQLIVFLAAAPLVTGLFGAFIGLQSRKSRQLLLLAASNAIAPEYVKKKTKTGFLDRIVYRLNPDGTDMLVAGLKND